MQEQWVSDKDNSATFRVANYSGVDVGVGCVASAQARGAARRRVRRNNARC